MAAFSYLVRPPALPVVVWLDPVDTATELEDLATPPLCCPIVAPDLAVLTDRATGAWEAVGAPGVL
jgi:hypothetical protein